MEININSRGIAVISRDFLQERFEIEYSLLYVLERNMRVVFRAIPNRRVGFNTTFRLFRKSSGKESDFVDFSLFVACRSSGTNGNNYLIV